MCSRRSGRLDRSNANSATLSAPPLTPTAHVAPRGSRSLFTRAGKSATSATGLELASIMGDEIRDPRRTLPGAVACGGVISGLLYIGVTLVLLIAIGKNEISVLQGIVQAVSHLAHEVNVGWIVAPLP